MAVTYLDPAGLPTGPLYHQVAVASGSRLVFLAGQVAVDAHGTPVGSGDLAAQVEQCYANVATALTAVGATFADVTRLTAYIVDWTPAKMAQLVEGMQRAARAHGIHTAPPLTGIGVQALASPDYLIELEATAVLP